MEDGVGLDLWIILILIPSVISWLIGDMCGSWRIRRMFSRAKPTETDSRPMLFHSEPADPSVFLDEHEALPRPQNPQATQHSEAQSDNPSGVPVISRRNADSHRLPTDSALALQSGRSNPKPAVELLIDLQAQAEAVGDTGAIIEDRGLFKTLFRRDPVAAEILSQYQRSIDQMAVRDEYEDAISVVWRELPRFSELAPLSPHTRAAHLAIERQAQTDRDRLLDPASWLA